MKILNYLFENPPKIAKFVDRKCKFDDKKVLLKGATNSGKTALMVDFLQKFERFLYINLDDFRNHSEEIFPNLNSFIKSSKIQALGIDGAKADFSEVLECENIIISTRSNSLNLDNFKEISVFGLDYEEFIAFYKKNYDPKTIFSHFLLKGNGCANAFLSDFEIPNFLQANLQKSLNLSQIYELSKFSNFIHQSFSGFKIYKDLKQNLKLSKDKFYDNIDFFMDNNFIKFVPKFDEKSEAKRLYFLEFALRDSLNFKKDFSATFANMVFCELLKCKSEIFFTDEIDFYLPKTKQAIICIPFSSFEIINLRFKKHLNFYKNLGISKVNVISVANEYKISIDGIKLEIEPFWQWASGQNI